MTFQQSPLLYPPPNTHIHIHTQDFREAGNSPLTRATQSLKHCQVQLCVRVRWSKRMRKRMREREGETDGKSNCKRVSEWVRKRMRGRKALYSATSCAKASLPICPGEHIPVTSAPYQSDHLTTPACITTEIYAHRDDSPAQTLINAHIIPSEKTRKRKPSAQKYGKWLHRTNNTKCFFLWCVHMHIQVQKLDVSGWTASTQTRTTPNHTTENGRNCRHHYHPHNNPWWPH